MFWVLSYIGLSVLPFLFHSSLYLLLCHYHYLWFCLCALFTILFTCTCYSTFHNLWTNSISVSYYLFYSPKSKFSFSYQTLVILRMDLRQVAPPGPPPNKYGMMGNSGCLNTLRCLSVLSSKKKKKPISFPKPKPSTSIPKISTEHI